MVSRRFRRAMRPGRRARIKVSNSRVSWHFVQRCQPLPLSHPFTKLPNNPIAVSCISITTLPALCLILAIATPQQHRSASISSDMCKAALLTAAVSPAFPAAVCCRQPGSVLSPAVRLSLPTLQQQRDPPASHASVAW